MSRASTRKQRRLRRKRRRPIMLPSDIFDDTSRQRGHLAGFRLKKRTRFHRRKPGKDKS